MQHQSSRASWVIGGIVTLLVLILIGVGIFFFTSRSTSEQVKEISFGDALVLWEEETLSVLNPLESDSVLGEWNQTFSHVFSTRYGTRLLLIEQGEKEHQLYELYLTEEGASLKPLYRFVYSFTKETLITADEDSLTFFEPSLGQFTNVNGEFLSTKVVQLKDFMEEDTLLEECEEGMELSSNLFVEDSEIPTEEEVEEAGLTAWLSTDQSLYIAFNQALYHYDWESESFGEILQLEDTTHAIFMKQERLFVLNNFGLTSNYQTMFELHPTKLTVLGLEKWTGTKPVIDASLSQTNLFFARTQSKKGNVTTIYDVKTLKSVGTLTPILDETMAYHFAHEFVYVLDTDANGRVYSIYATTPVYETKQPVKGLYPLWKETYAKMFIEVEEESNY